jgi:hypothetical protein
MIREKNVTICSCDRSAWQQSAATVYFKKAYSKSDSFVSLFLEMEKIVTQKTAYTSAGTIGKGVLQANSCRQQ